ncbi:hypothetical protein KI387_004470, partial [Taxus chinensis]
EEGGEGLTGWQGNQSSGVHHSETSKSLSPSTRFQSDEISSSGDELTTKVRKPYTITKQRERWTEEEHQKFLEALKMHGRAWRRIEEHIGTKTAVQIRSHAQKFFSKLERESSTRGVPAGKTQDISIPPPRPKRKPSHPYPRKAGTTIQSGFSANEEDNRTPQAVSSAPVGLNLGGTAHKNAAFSPYNARPSPIQMKGNIDLQEEKLELSFPNSSPSSLKLFGQTVVVPTNKSASDGNVKEAFREFASLKQEVTLFEVQYTEDPKVKNGKVSIDTLSLKPQTKLVKSANAPQATSNIPPSEAGASVLECSGESNSNSPRLENHTGQQDSDEQVSSELDNNSSYLSSKHQASVPATGYPRHVPVQHVETGNPDNTCDFMRCRPNAASLAHEFAAMNMMHPNSSSPNMSGNMQTDVQNSLQPNFLLPFPGMPGPFNPAYNNLENFGCVPGFIAPGSAPNGPLPPWHLTQSVLHHPAYAAATLAAARFWPGLVSGASAATIGDPQPPNAGLNAHAFCDETSAAAAITAATVAAASAWWTLHGAIPPPFIHPGIYTPVVTAMAAEAAAVATAAAASGNSSPGCKTEPVTEARKQDHVAAMKEADKILDAVPINPHVKTDRKVSMQQVDDGNMGLCCRKSGPSDCFPQASPSGSEQNATSCMEESCSAGKEKQNLKIKEKDHDAHDTYSPDGENSKNRKFIKKRSSSGSNTPSSAEPETDAYLETNIEMIKGNNKGDFEFNGSGNCTSEQGGEDILTKETGCCTLPQILGKIEGEKINSSTKHDEKMDDIKKHIPKERHQSHGGDAAGRRSKPGGHIGDTWKEVSEEGRIAFQALFSRDVLPQSFSSQSLRLQAKSPKSSEESLCNNAKQKLIISSTDEMNIDIKNSLLNESQTNIVVIQAEDNRAQEIPSNTAASLAQEKKLQESGATVSDQSLEEYGTSLSPNENASVDTKLTKSSVILSFGNFRSGRGFVPYQRCSIEAKKNRLHARPTQNCQDGIREEKRICLEQEVKER